MTFIPSSRVYANLPLFIIAKNDVKFKCVLIIDDIYTTGSTIDEIAHEFRMAGVQKIYCLTLAIGQTT